jgi:hypothetical protein
VRRPALPLLAAAVLAALAMPPPASALTKEPQPELGRSFVAALVSGEVFVKPPGARASRLTERRTIPVGTRVDATKGRVKLVGVLTHERRSKGVFSKGAFIATQARRKRAVIDLELTGGDFKGCDAARTSALGRRVVRKLRGRARGRFRTSGNHSAATVRGTKWLTEDHCDTTVIETEKGVVDVALASGSLELPSGNVFEAACDPPLGTRLPPNFCLATLNSPADGIFGVGIGTRVHTGEYTQCIFAPSGAYLCRAVPLPEPAPGDDFRISVLGCAPDGGAGTYTAAWYYQDALIGALEVPVTNPFAPGTGICLVTFDDLDSASRQSRSSSGWAEQIQGRPPGASALFARPRP